MVVFVFKFAWLLAVLVAVALAGRLIGGWLARRDDRAAAARRRDAELCARADRQHAAVLAGDDRLGVVRRLPSSRMTVRGYLSRLILQTCKIRRSCTKLIHLRSRQVIQMAKWTSYGPIER